MSRYAMQINVRHLEPRQLRTFFNQGILKLRNFLSQSDVETKSLNIFQKYTTIFLNTRKVNDMGRRYEQSTEVEDEP